jgi:hypothetical protein
MIRFFLLFLGKEIGFRVMNLSFYTKFFFCSTNTFFLVNAINNCFYFCYSLWLSFVFWKEILTPKLSFSYFYLSIATAMNRYVVVRYIFVRNLALQFSAGQAGQLYYPSLPFFFLPNFFFHCEVKSRPTARAVYFPWGAMNRHWIPNSVHYIWWPCHFYSLSSRFLTIDLAPVRFHRRFSCLVWLHLPFECPVFDIFF